MTVLNRGDFTPTLTLPLKGEGIGEGAGMTGVVTLLDAVLGCDYFAVMRGMV